MVDIQKIKAGAGLNVVPKASIVSDVSLLAGTVLILEELLKNIDSRSTAGFFNAIVNNKCIEDKRVYDELVKILKPSGYKTSTYISGFNNTYELIVEW